MRYNNFLFFPLILFLVINAQSQTIKEIERFTISKARQAVAVDDQYFYVINNSSISKHDKQSGEEVSRWQGDETQVQHLNSGIILDGLLYCAHSNYPDMPMAGSIEIFDPKTMKHVSNHSFGIYVGSPTWIDRKDGFWYVGFAHYSGKRSSENKDTSWTQIVKFDKDWNRVGGFIFPKNLIEKFRPMSNSGAIWVGDELYVTGHDYYEVYVLKSPQIGYTMQYIKTLQVPFFGQGIAIDEVGNKKYIYGIIKKTNEVIVSEIKF